VCYNFLKQHKEAFYFMSTSQTAQSGLNAQKILARTKGLQRFLQPDEEPLLKVPAIWDNGQTHQSKPCNVIVTNLRLMGFEFVTFPRERVFLEDFPLAAVSSVTLRHKMYEPLSRELVVSDGERKVYIRAPRKHIEALYATLRLVTEYRDYIGEHQQAEDMPPTTPAPIYGRQDIRTTFERSPLAIVLLFVGGLVLELIGVAGWLLTGNLQVGIPLFIAGFIAVVVATFVRRQRG
jgi:hypothetical protein